MRIAYLINSLEGGGAAFLIPAIARALRDCGAELTVFALTRRDGRALPTIEANGLKTRVRDGGEKDHFSALAWLDRQFQEFKPEIIWTSLTRATLLGQIIGARRRIPVVSWQHAAFLKPANLRLLRASKGLSALWVADSNAVAEFTSRKIGVAPVRLVTWPILVGDPGASLTRPLNDGEEIRIGSLGRLHRVKGYDVLLRSLLKLDKLPTADLPKYRVIIGGDGEEREGLLEQARSAAIANVEFAGFIADPRKFLASCHLYVQPSRSEGFCVAGHEAMQAGLPVIASSVGELATSVQPGLTGWLVPPNDPAALASALEQALGRPSLLHSIGSAGRDHLFRRFGRQEFLRGAKAIYEQLGGLSPAGRRTNRKGSGQSVSRRIA